MLTAGSILLVHILMFVIWDQEDPSAARTGAAKWSATISIDGIPLTDVSGGGGNVIDTGYIQTGVVAKSLFPLAPAKTHKLLGYFPAVFIEGLSKGTHELSGHYVISPGENETTFKHTITVT